MNGYEWQGWWTPWQRMREMERAMGRLFRDYSAPVGATFPPVNVYPGEEEVTITAELPGVETKDLAISIQNQTLVLHGERKEPDPNENDLLLRQERIFGEFTRNFNLTFPVDQEKVDATCRDGVLKVRLQRSKAAMPKQIPVKS